MSCVKLACIDLVGTAVEDGGLVRHALKKALSVVGLDVDPPDLAPWQGADPAEILGHYGGEMAGREDAVTQVQTAFRDYLLQITSAFRAAPGARPALEELTRAGVRCVLTTGLDRDLARLLVARTGLSSWVDSLVCRSEVERGPPAPFLIYRAMERTGVDDCLRVTQVGDSVRGAVAGSKAGVGLNVLVRTEPVQPEEPLASVPGLLLISTLAELPPLLDRTRVS